MGVNKDAIVLMGDVFQIYGSPWSRSSTHCFNDFVNFNINNKKSYFHIHFLSNLQQDKSY